MISPIFFSRPGPRRPGRLRVRLSHALGTVRGVIQLEDITRWRRSLAMSPQLPARELHALLNGAEELLARRASIDGQLARVRYGLPALDSLVDQVVDLGE